MREAPAALLIAAALTGFGCDQSPATEIAQATPASARTAPEQPAEGAAESENVITRNRPRFHDAFESDEAFLAWQESFYIHREYERVHEAIGYFCASELYTDVYNRIPMAAFVGAILKHSDETVDRCWDELMLEGREDELMTLGYGAWLANTPHTRQMIIKARENWLDEDLRRMFHMLFQAKNLDSMERPTEDSRVVMMLWSEFFATGDEERLRRVVLLSHMHNAPEGTWQRSTGQAARERLVRVLPFDPLVRRVVENEAANNPMTHIRTHLSLLLEEAGPLRERPGITPGS